MRDEREKLSRAAFEFENDEDTRFIEDEEDEEEILEEPKPPQLLDESMEAAEISAKVQRTQGIIGGLILGAVIGLVLALILLGLRYVARTVLYMEILPFNTWYMLLFCVLGGILFTLIIALTTKPTPEDQMKRAKEYNAEVLAQYEQDKLRYERWKCLNPDAHNSETQKNKE